MHPLQFRQLYHKLQDTIGIGCHIFPSLTLYTHLKRVLHRLIVQLFETRVGVRKIILILGGIFTQYLRGCLAGFRIDYQLRIIRRRRLRRVCGMETRRSLTNKRRHTLHSLVMTQYFRQRVRYSSTLLRGGAFVQMNLHRKKLTFCFR